MVKPTRITNSIRALRFTHGQMTQADLAERVGVTRQTIIAIEQGRYSPSLEMAFQIARVFGVPRSAWNGRAAETGGDVPVPQQDLRRFVCVPKLRELADLSELVETGKLVAVIGRTHPLTETPSALRHIESGHARGKVVITPPDRQG